MKEEIVEIKARPTFILFPRGLGAKIDNENSWACIKFKIDSVVSGIITPEEEFGGIIIVGNYGFDPLKKSNGEEDIYTVKFSRGFNKKRNSPQNELINISLEYDFENEKDQKNFLKHIITVNQIKELYLTLDNPFKCIVDKDIEQLSKVKGIGEKVAQRIIRKYEENISYRAFYVELPNLEISQRQIEILVEHYGNIPTTIEAIKSNPYQLMEVSGFSFKKADAIALQMGLSKTAVCRIKAFITTHLELVSNTKGLNWLEGKELTNDLYNTLGNSEDINEYFTEEEMNNNGYEEDNNIAEAVRQLVKEGTLIIDKEDEPKGKRYYLKKIYNIEKEVAGRLIRRINTPVSPVEEGLEERVKRIEEQNGWEFNEGQWSAIKKGCESNVIVIHGGAGCVDNQTEFFNGAEWKSISDFTPKDRVLQYNGMKNCCELVRPAAYIKNETEDLFELKSKHSNGIDMCLSLDHWCLYSNGREYIKEQTKDILKKHKRKGFRGMFPATFGGKYNGLTFDESGVKYIAGLLYSDKYYVNNGNNICTVIFSKNNNRLNEKLDIFQNSISNFIKSEYEKIENEENIIFYFEVPSNIKRVMYNWSYFSEENAKNIINTLNDIYCNESFLSTGIFKTKNKDAVDYLQCLLGMCGKRSFIIRKEMKSDPDYGAYVLTIDTEAKGYYLTEMSQGGYERRVVPRRCINSDGYEYCFSVPSGVLVLRRHGKIFLTGNCGKTASLKGLLAALNVSRNEVAMCAFTGKAAARMQESSGYIASTIHKLLGIKGAEPAYNEDRKLPYKVIIMDEFSMTPLDLLRLLLRAMSPECKLILLGDSGQLQSISMGNLSTDLIQSPTIPSAGLTEIMRQALESGIINLAADINNGTTIFTSGYEGETLVKNDTYIFTDKDSGFLFDTIIEDFKARWEAGKIESKKDFIFLSPVKYRGELCSMALNNAIQDIVNPQSKFQQFTKEELRVEFKTKKGKKVSEEDEDNRSFVLRVGDNVICNQNKYKVKTVEVETVPNADGDGLQEEEITTNIFNGWTGELIKLDKNTQTGYFKFFDCEYVVELGIEDIKECITLGYAISIHKSQGGEWKEVYIAVDNAGYSILTREMLYTATTRAKNKLLMYVNPLAFNRAVGKKDSTLRRTFFKNY